MTPATLWATCTAAFLAYAYAGPLGIVALALLVAVVWRAGRRSGQASMWRRWGR